MDHVFSTMEYMSIYFLSDECPTLVPHPYPSFGMISCADPENFVRGGPTLTTFFFLIDEGSVDPNSTISGPSMAHQRNTI